MEFVPEIQHFFAASTGRASGYFWGARKAAKIRLNASKTAFCSWQLRGLQGLYTTVRG
jgi:hypothetical protein